MPKKKKVDPNSKVVFEAGESHEESGGNNNQAPPIIRRKRRNSQPILGNVPQQGSGPFGLPLISLPPGVHIGSSVDTQNNEFREKLKRNLRERIGSSASIPKTGIENSFTPNVFLLRKIGY